MLSPQLRSKVHNLWTLFWSAGMTNPLVAIEQITYLLFLRQLERLDADRVKAGKPSIYYEGTRPDSSKVDYNQCRWSYQTTRPLPPRSPPRLHRAAAVARSPRPAHRSQRAGRRLFTAAHS